MAKIAKKHNSRTENTVNDNKFAMKKKLKKRNKFGHINESSDINIKKSIKKNKRILSNKFKQRSKNEDSSSLLDPKITTIVDSRNNNGNKSVLPRKKKKKFNKKKQQKVVRKFEQQQHVDNSSETKSNVQNLKTKKNQLHKKAESNNIENFKKSKQKDIKKSIKKNTRILSNKFKQRNKNKESSSLLDPKITTIVESRNNKGNKSILPGTNKKKFNEKKQQKVVRKFEQQQHVDNSSNTKSNVQKLKRKKKQLPKKAEPNNIENFNKRKQKDITKSTSKKLKSLANKKMKQDRQNEKTFIRAAENDKDSQKKTKVHKLNVRRLEEMFANKNKQSKKVKKNNEPETLRQRMMNKLRSSRFRYLNETMYNSESSESKRYFKDDPDSFVAYHDGYKQQVEQWPMNPLDVIISSIKKMPKEHIIADFGCGEARLADSVIQKVHSFDFVSLSEKVTACDMAHTPLLTNGVHVVVFCLSLMGTNLNDYLIEANRILKNGGILKIADVESRFEQVDDFIKALREYGFKNTWKDLSHNLFYFLDFKKEKDISKKRNKLPAITLKPCLYKKR